MSTGMMLLIILGIVFSLILSSTWVFLSLALTGVFGLLLFSGYPVWTIVPQIAFSTNESFVLTCLPLFIFMGELLLHSGASKNLYSGLKPWVEPIPGKLLHSNILACTIFAAVSGSSAVTVATIGSIAVPELEKLGYNKGSVLGSLAGAGTLGLLIPPSIVMIVYGAITGNSVARLFAAGIFPGLLIALLFMIYVVVISVLRPSIAPPSLTEQSFKEKIIGTIKILPIIALICLVLGIIYLGIATPTEAGAIGAFGALVIVLTHGNMSWLVLKEASFTTLKTTCMVMFIVIGASILSSCLAYLKIPQDLMKFLAAIGLSKWVIFSIFCLIYIGLGCLFDGISMMLLTLPIIYPVIVGLGYNPIWFGVVLVVLIETAQITPPVGFNLYVLKNVSGESIGMIVKNAIPFFFLMLIGLIILCFVPQIALWLPDKLM